jgi:5-methylcytosine-specific restriction endonuclease McrA
VCGTEFYRFPKEIRRERLYCSYVCANLARRTPITEKPCAFCGAPLRLRPSEVGKRYCSWNCKIAAKYKHALDRMHNGKPARLTHEGYVKVWEPEHANAQQGWVLEHRLLMERHLGRPLTAAEEVDHINSDRSDNRLENLQVLAKGAHRKKTGADARKRRLTMRERLAEYERRFGPLED